MTKNISSLDPKQVGKDCNIILNARMERLKQCIDECKELLKKEDFNNYKMPEIPSFDIDIPIHEETLKVDLKDQSYQKIKGELDHKLYQEPNWLLRLRENFKNGTWYDQKWKAKDMSKAEFEKKFGKSAPAIKEMARDMGLTKSVIGDREKLKKNIHKCMHEIEGHFDDINERLKEGIKEFVKDVDDSEKYRKNIQMLEQEEEFIWEIETKIGGFLGFWNEIRL